MHPRPKVVGENVVYFLSLRRQPRNIDHEMFSRGQGQRDRVSTDQIPAEIRAHYLSIITTTEFRVINSETYGKFKTGKTETEKSEWPKVFYIIVRLFCGKPKPNLYRHIFYKLLY